MAGTEKHKHTCAYNLYSGVARKRKNNNRKHIQITIHHKTRAIVVLMMGTYVTENALALGRTRADVRKSRRRSPADVVCHTMRHRTVAIRIWAAWRRRLCSNGGAFELRLRITTTTTDDPRVSYYLHMYPLIMTECAHARKNTDVRDEHECKHTHEKPHGVCLLIGQHNRCGKMLCLNAKCVA